MNPQEKLWAGDFGTEYHERNNIEDRKRLWGRALKNGYEYFRSGSVLELGAGKGDNLIAIRDLNTAKICKYTGVEINPQACEEMREHGFNVVEKSVLDIAPGELGMYDTIITRGFLIHQNPMHLPHIYHLMHAAESRYICLAEYYAPETREMKYRGNDSALWLGDFAGDMLDRYDDMRLVNYGFEYGRMGGHDLTWFLLEKKIK